MFSTILIISFVLFCLLTMVINLRRDRKKHSHPPCPFLFPVIGNIYYMNTQTYKTFQRLAKKLGPIMTIWLGSKPMYVINNINMAKKLLIGNTTALSDRPRRSAGKLYSCGFKGIILANYGTEYKESRTLLHLATHSYLGLHGRIESLIIEECIEMEKVLEEKILSGPVNPCDIISCSVTNVMTGILFGERYRPNDIEFKELKTANNDMMKGISLAPLYDFFPFLKILPFGSFYRFKNAVMWRNKTIRKKIEEHKTSMRNSRSYDLTSALIQLATEGQQNGKFGSISEEQIQMILSDFYIAGTETSAVVIHWALLYLTLYPEVQDKVQQELDNVLCDRKFVSLSDESRLPYTLATINEVMRVGSVAPFGVPRVARNDVSVGDYSIKEGSLVILNIYSIHHDSDHWTDPYRFYPERFLDTEGRCNQNDKSFMPFSSGIRACTGKKIAMAEIFLFIGFLLKRFRFEKATNNTAYTTEGVLSSTLNPKPFKIKIVSR